MKYLICAIVHGIVGISTDNFFIMGFTAIVYSYCIIKLIEIKLSEN